MSTLEIALLIMLPLLSFYQNSKWEYRKYVPIMVILYFIWYFTYALFHELSHALGVWITNKTIYDYQLIPHFWKGDFGTGYINYNYNGDSKDFFITILPYLKDIILLFTGYYLFKKIKTKSPFLIGLVLILCILSPLYDIINNYQAYLFGSMNDFNSLKESGNGFLSHGIGILFSLTALMFTYIILKGYKNYPIHVNEQIQK